ncbi:MAG: HAD family phosphatase [Pseudomonadota bacterium]
MTYRAVLFDCDGVLVDSEIVGLEDSAAFLKSHGFTWSAADLIRQFTGKRDDRLRAELGEKYSEILGRQASEAETDVLVEGLIAARRAKRDTMQSVPGAHDAVQAAIDAGLSLAVASSSRKVFLDSKIDRFGFRPLVGEHVYSADAVRHGKPSPDIFLYAAERLDIDPAACLVIEDSAFGVEAGIAAGMTVWGFTGGGHCLEDHGERLANAGALRIHRDHVALQQGLRAVTQEH